MRDELSLVFEVSTIDQQLEALAPRIPALCALANAQPPHYGGPNPIGQSVVHLLEATAETFQTDPLSDVVAALLGIDEAHRHKPRGSRLDVATIAFCDRIWPHDIKADSFARRHKADVLDWFANRLLEVDATRRVNRPAPLGSMAALREIRRGDHVARSTWSYEKWHMDIVVDDTGTAHSHIRAVLRNTSVETQPMIAIPVWSDSDEPPVGTVTIAHRSTRVRLDPWDENTNQGYLPVRFPKPLRPQDPITFELDYLQPGAFRDADDGWFEWYFGALHFEYRLQLSFDPPWRLGPVRPYVKELPEYPVPPPDVSESSIRWLVRFPVLAATYRLDFDLARKGKDK